MWVLNSSNGDSISMEELVNNVITLDMDEIESYDFPLDDVFGLEVINKGIKFCFIICTP